MTTTAALFPWLPGDPDRDAAADWVMAGWRVHHPGVALFDSAGMARSAGAADHSWSKGEHTAWMLKRVGPDVDVVVVSDVDCWVAPDEIATAIEAVASGGFGWAVPHRDVRRLTRARTLQFLAQPAPAAEVLVHASELTEAPYLGFAGGGVVVLSGQAARQVPLDPRFRGWGQEDTSWALALATMLGAPYRGLHDLLHLWHPPMPRRCRAFGSDENVLLMRRYAAAEGDRVTMAQILEEVGAAATAEAAGCSPRR
jgi:hypothetical protein